VIEDGVHKPLCRAALGKRVGRMRWLRRGLRDRLIRRIAPRPMIAGADFEVDFHGYRYQGTLGNWIDDNIYFYGGYEDDIQDLLAGLAKERRERCFVDVGANFGIHVLRASRLFDTVHAFEPYPPVRDRLCALLDLNGVENVTVHGVGVGSENATRAFYAPTPENLGAGSYVEDWIAGASEYGSLAVVAGDAYFDTHVDPVGVIKVDVEGYELEVLRGLRSTLSRWRPDVIVEFSKRSLAEAGSVRGLLHWMPGEYRIFGIRGRKTIGWVVETPTLQLIPVTDTRLRPDRNWLIVPEERVSALEAARLMIV